MQIDERTFRKIVLEANRLGRHGVYVDDVFYVPAPTPASEDSYGFYTDPNRTAATSEPS